MNPLRALATPARLRGPAAALLGAAALLCLALPGGAADLYSNDFQVAAGPEWNYTVISATPLPVDGSRRFLGPFDNQTVTLTVPDHHAHTSVTLTLDFYCNATWDGVDGSGLGYGPDWWTAAVVGGPTLLHTTFSNVTSPPFGIPFLQNFPDSWESGITHPQFTGSVEQRTLGYVFYGYDVSSVYHLTFTVPHTDTSITFAFTGLMNNGYSGPHDITEESWGLDNVVVTDNGTAGVPAAGAARFALAGARVNPAPARGLVAEFDLPDASPARLELLDVAGRRVAGTDVGALGAGHHAVPLSAAVAPRAGLYFVRLTQGARAATRRVTLLD